MRRQLAIGALALAMIGGGGAVAAAATGSGSGAAPSTTAPSTTAPSHADRLDRVEARLRERLDPLVKDGTLTQAQQDKVVAALATAPHDRDGAPRGRFGPRGILGEGAKVAADAIGITPEELRTGLRSGTSIADVAKAHGVDPSKVVSALQGALDERLDDAVAKGRITRERADTLKADAAKRMTDMVNATPPIRPDRGTFGPGHGMPHRPSGE
ncbi:MAG: hypothetical protein R2698_06755 [Microthrixaceae bacterium]